MKPNFKTIQKMMAEARALKTSSLAYKKQIEDLAAANKKLPWAEKEEEEEEPLLKKGKRAAGPTGAPTVARAAMRQKMIPTGVVIGEKPSCVPEVTPMLASTPTTVAPPTPAAAEERKKRARPSKEQNFLGCTS